MPDSSRKSTHSRSAHQPRTALKTPFDSTGTRSPYAVSYRGCAQKKECCRDKNSESVRIPRGAFGSSGTQRVRRRALSPERHAGPLERDCRYARWLDGYGSRSGQNSKRLDRIHRDSGTRRGGASPRWNHLRRRERFIPFTGWTGICRVYRNTFR